MNKFESKAMEHMEEAMWQLAQAMAAIACDVDSHGKDTDIGQRLSVERDIVRGLYQEYKTRNWRSFHKEENAD